MADEQFDLLIIGGGIHGACAAYEAARRGVKTALAEAGDYCSGNSANSLKIVHGGLRYLQTLDIRRMRDSIRERNAYLRLAPHLVTPLSCVLPTFGMTTKSKHALRAALLLNDFVSLDRNAGLDDPDSKLGPGKILGRRKLHELVPYLPEGEFTGGALWHDAQLQNTERFVLGFIKAAQGQGAETANYLKVLGIHTAGGSVNGARVVDQISGEEFDIQARTILSCAGPGVNGLLENAGSRPFQPSVAINLIFDVELPGGLAAGLRHVFSHNGKKWSRIFFYTPWRGRLVAGTRHTPVSDERQLRGITEQQIESYIKELKETTPALDLSRETLSHWHWGIIPMDGISEKNGTVNLSSESSIIDHADDGYAGLTTLIGVKYTTGRLAAERAVRKHCKVNELPLNTGKLPLVPLPGGDLARARQFAAELEENGVGTISAKSLERCMGDEAGRLLPLIENDGSLAERIDEQGEVIGAQVLDAVRHESALQLSDVVLRRTGLGSHQRPAEAAVDAVSKIMANELGWSEGERTSQIDRLAMNYTPLP